MCAKQEANQNLQAELASSNSRAASYNRSYIALLESVDRDLTAEEDDRRRTVSYLHSKQTVNISQSMAQPSVIEAGTHNVESLRELSGGTPGLDKHACTGK